MHYFFCLYIPGCYDMFTLYASPSIHSFLIIRPHLFPFFICSPSIVPLIFHSDASRLHSNLPFFLFSHSFLAALLPCSLHHSLRSPLPSFINIHTSHPEAAICVQERRCILPCCYSPFFLSFAFPSFGRVFPCV